MFKQRKHRSFNYKPRFQDSEIQSSKTDDIESKWNGIKQNSKRRGSILMSLPVLIIILVLLFGLMYLLEGYI